MKRVFIGGMGRSGTTITLNALYRHGELAAVPIETKFLVEADGFSELANALTSNFSTAVAPLAIERFKNLMLNLVTGKEPSPFSEMHDLAPNFFPHYETAVQELCSNFVSRVRFDREELLIPMRRFVEITFDDLALQAEKTGWVEKTPANLWRIDFLRELFPDSYFVHLIRDPRLIFLSLLEKNWLPRDLKISVPQFRDMADALVAQRRKLQELPNYIEIHLESLECALADTLQGLAFDLGLKPFTDEAIVGVGDAMKKYNESKPDDENAIRFTLEEATWINQQLQSSVSELAYPNDFPLVAMKQG